MLSLRPLDRISAATHDPPTGFPNRFTLPSQVGCTTEFESTLGSTKTSTKPAKIAGTLVMKSIGSGEGEKCQNGFPVWIRTAQRQVQMELTEKRR